MEFISKEKSAKPHQWDDAKEWLDKYDHPLWARWSKETEGAGHGGMDFFVIHSFIESIKRKVHHQWMCMMLPHGALSHP